LKKGRASKKAEAPWVLVVEDDPASLLLARASLEQAGYRVEGVGSAEAARQAVAGRKPDLILMDIQLPGVDGLAMTRELKSSPATKGIPVIALTGHAMPLYEREARAAGCHGFIEKPALPEVIVAEVRRVLAGAR
jgi:CheY-like chemotaxis protein